MTLFKTFDRIRKLKIINYIIKSRDIKNYITLDIFKNDLDFTEESYNLKIESIKTTINERLNYIDWGNLPLDSNPEELYFIDDSYDDFKKILLEKGVSLAELDLAMALKVREQFVLLKLVPIELLSYQEKEIADYQKEFFKTYKQELFIKMVLDNGNKLLKLSENAIYYRDITNRINYSNFLTSGLLDRVGKYYDAFSYEQKVIDQNNIDFWNSHSGWLKAADWKINLAGDKTSDVALKYGLSLETVEKMNTILNKVNLNSKHIDAFLEFKSLSKLIMIENNVYYNRYQLNSLDDFLSLFYTLKEKFSKDIIEEYLFRGYEHFQEASLVIDVVNKQVDYMIYPFITGLERLFDMDIVTRAKVFARSYQVVLNSIAKTKKNPNLIEEILSGVADDTESTKNEVVTFGYKTWIDMTCSPIGSTDSPDCRKYEYELEPNKVKDRIIERARLFFNTIKKGNIYVVDSDDRVTAVLQGYYNHGGMAKDNNYTQKDYDYDIGRDQSMISSTTSHYANGGDSRFGDLIKYRSEKILKDDNDMIKKYSFGDFEVNVERPTLGGALFEHRETHQAFKFMHYDDAANKELLNYTTNLRGELYEVGTPAKIAFSGDTFIE